MSQDVTGSYVWGLDSSPGTFITDYILGGLCSLYGLCILSLYKGPASFRTRYGWKDSYGNKASPEHHRRNVETSHPLLLTLSLMFLSCGLMYVTGAILHHFVSLVEPDTQLPESTGEEHDNLDFWSRMRLQLYPWYLAWQLANILAILYGICTFLSAMYTLDFDLCLGAAEDDLRNTATVDGVEKTSVSERKTITWFPTVKKVTVRAAVGLFALFVVFRFWRILEYRKGIFDGSATDEQNVELDIQQAKMDYKKMGIWSGTAASVAMFLAFVTNSALSTYLTLKRPLNSQKATFCDGSASRKPKIRITRTIASWVLVFAALVQVFNAASCGRNPPTDCPFPISFNHNAFYHVFQGIGLTMWFFAEWRCFSQYSRNISGKKVE